MEVGGRPSGLRLEHIMNGGISTWRNLCRTRDPAITARKYLHKITNCIIGGSDPATQRQHGSPESLGTAGGAWQAPRIRGGTEEEPVCFYQGRHAAEGGATICQGVALLLNLGVQRILLPLCLAPITSELRAPRSLLSCSSLTRRSGLWTCGLGRAPCPRAAPLRRRT